MIAPGARADLALWALPSEVALVQPWGAPPLAALVLGGQVVERADHG